MRMRRICVNVFLINCPYRLATHFAYFTMELCLSRGEPHQPM
jgi:hypothetical protein